MRFRPRHVYRPSPRRNTGPAWVLVFRCGCASWATYPTRRDADRALEVLTETAPRFAGATVDRKDHPRPSWIDCTHEETTP